MVLYRDHRGGLAESMATVVGIANGAELVNHINKTSLFGPLITADDIECRPYGWDARINWDTHIVSRRDHQGVFGFTDGPLLDLPTSPAQD